MYSVVIEFNEGCQGIQKVLEYMGLGTGLRLITKSRKRNLVRVRKMVRKCSEKGKTRRKTITRVKKRHADKAKELEAKH